MGIVSKPFNFTTGVISPDEANANFDTLYVLQDGNIESVNIKDDALTDDDMRVEVKPVTRHKENLANHVASGLTLTYTTDTTRVATLVPGTAYVEGVRVVTDANSTHACATNSTTYVDLSKTGAYSWNQNASPAANYKRLYSVTCDATVITSTTAIRNLCAVGSSQIEEGAATKVYAAKNAAAVSNTTTLPATCLDLGTVSVGVGDELTYVAKAGIKANTAINVRGSMNIGGSNESIDTVLKVDTSLGTLVLNGAYSVTTASAALPIIFTFRTYTTAGTATASMRSLTVVRHRR